MKRPRRFPPPKLYSITVDGFAPIRYVARTRGRALACCWRDYTRAYDCSFRDFLARVTVLHLGRSEGVGKRIIVRKTEVAFCGRRGNQVEFMFDNSDQLLTAHELDVVFLSDNPTGARGAMP